MRYIRILVLPDFRELPMSCKLHVVYCIKLNTSVLSSSDGQREADWLVPLNFRRGRQQNHLHWVLLRHSLTRYQFVNSRTHK